MEKVRQPLTPGKIESHTEEGAFYETWIRRPVKHVLNREVAGMVNKINHIHGGIETSVCLQPQVWWERASEGGQEHAVGGFWATGVWVSVTRRMFCCCWKMNWDGSRSRAGQEAIAGSGSGSPCLESSIHDQVESRWMKESSPMGAWEWRQGVAVTICRRMI